eukprot:Pompholyxophrys_punicea_v1_NODE_152_length_3178_cov_3.531540.p3 type:complete len:150 gc:universal NODE_152_length_3178_cov_3.531540:1354-905(-)
MFLNIRFSSRLNPQAPVSQESTSLNFFVRFALVSSLESHIGTNKTLNPRDFIFNGETKFISSFKVCVDAEKSISGFSMTCKIFDTLPIAVCSLGFQCESQRMMSRISKQSVPFWRKKLKILPEKIPCLVSKPTKSPTNTFPALQTIIGV